MNVLIAPDKFKDALDATGVAAALAAGARAACPKAKLRLCPLADGGDGTGEVLANALRADARDAAVLDPHGRPITARWWHARATHTAIIEMATASGLARLTPDERDPLRTSTYGTGQLIHAAITAGCRTLLLGVGGSATVDGGAGCLQALGWSLLDAHGRSLPAPLPGGRVGDVAALLPPAAPLNADLTILCDVTHPLLGPHGAARIFGPQKGATPAAVIELERGLTHWALLLARTTGHDIRNLPGTGAAGGLPAALHAACHATLQPGFDVIAQHVALADQLRAADLCLTGEGQLDAQTIGGKVVSGVAQAARTAGVPVLVFTGALRHDDASLSDTLGVARIITVTPPGTPLPAALQQTAANLQRAARDAVAAYFSKDLP